MTITQITDRERDLTVFNMPEPAMTYTGPDSEIGYYNETQVQALVDRINELEAYGEACYTRAIEDAAKVCDGKYMTLTPYRIYAAQEHTDGLRRNAADLKTAIRALLKGEK